MPAETVSSMPSLRDVYRARARISSHVRRTPLVRSAPLSLLSGSEVHLKLETLQDIGAFKLRGAVNRIMTLDDEERRRGVVTMSTGNHGRAVAYAAGRLGVPAIVCLSELVAGNKVEAIRELGAEARIIGRSQDEAGEEALRLVREEGMVLIPPFDDPAVIAGQGTIGLELLEDLPDVDEVLVPLSGGGLIAGIALALKSADRAIRVVGVSMTRGAAMAASLAAGHPVAVKEEPTLADSLGGGIGLDNRYTFELVRRHVDDVLLLDEEEIADGMRHLYRKEGLVAEGAAAVGVAALIAGRAGGAGRRIATVISGRNVDMASFGAIVAAEST
ncbi:MAG TPA: hydroxyectoine utilization dehydratase EutB [Alphaproteobacteria bacterium]|nr:hydroxyectoine utilization dehydratase EutB [Alphaproteobacteria bacterium]